MILRLKHWNTCPGSIALNKSAHEGRTGLPCPEDWTVLRGTWSHITFCWFIWSRWPPGWHQQYLHLCASPFPGSGCTPSVPGVPATLAEVSFGSQLTSTWISPLPSAPTSAVRGRQWCSPVLPIWNTGAFCFSYTWSLFLKLAFYSSGTFFQHLSWSIKSTADIPSSYN